MKLRSTYSLPAHGEARGLRCRSDHGPLSLCPSQLDQGPVWSLVLRLNRQEQTHTHTHTHTETSSYIRSKRTEASAMQTMIVLQQDTRSSRRLEAGFSVFHWVSTAVKRTETPKTNSQAKIHFSSPEALHFVFTAIVFVQCPCGW